MKKLLCLSLIILVVLSATQSFGQLNVWRAQNPPTIAGTLNAVQMISANKIYVVGDKATFMNSNDSGNSWQVHTPITNLKDFSGYALSFIDSMRGMVVGKGGAIKTIDGGNTWTKMSIAVTGGQTTFNDVLMFDDNIGFIVGPKNVLLKSTNAGTTWTAYLSELTVGSLNCIRKVRPDYLVIGGEGGYLLISQDTGKTWNKIKTSSSNDISSISYTNISTAIGVGPLGYITKTNDSGKTWASQPLIENPPIGSVTFNDVESRDGTHFIMVGDVSTLIYSTDAGASWKKVFLGLGGTAIKSLDLWSPLYGIAVGGQGVIMRTTDGGENWKFLPNTPFYTTLYSIAFRKGDTSNGLAVGMFGSLLKTTNGGKKWTSMTPLVFNNLRSVTFADSLTAYIVGDNGLMYKSVDQGETWALQTIPTKANLRSICFTSLQEGYAVGDSGTVLKTNTSGVQWHKLKIGLGDTEVCFGVSFSDLKNGMITSNFDTRFTTDGGLSWRKDSLIPGYACWMVSPTHHSVVSFNVESGLGTITTRNNGDTTVVNGFSKTFYSVTYADKLRGTAVGFDGQIFHTTDGGRTWALQLSNTTSTLYYVAYPSINAASTCGIRGAILRITSDEPPLKVTPQQPTASENSEIFIEAAYPNPANKFTTVRYSLARPMPLEISLFDQLGATMRSVNLGIVSSGQQQFELPLDNLSSGSYILQIKSQNEAKTIHLSVTK